MLWPCGMKLVVAPTLPRALALWKCLTWFLAIGLYWVGLGPQVCTSRHSFLLWCTHQHVSLASSLVPKPLMDCKSSAESKKNPPSDQSGSHRLPVLQLLCLLHWWVFLTRASVFPIVVAISEVGEAPPLSSVGASVASDELYQCPCDRFLPVELAL